MISKISLFAISLVLAIPLIFVNLKAGASQGISAPSNYEIQNKESIGYEIMELKWEDADSNTKIIYPQITGYKGELLMDYMNQSLKKIVDIYGKKDAYKDVSINYKITKADSNIISVLFEGKGKVLGGRDINIKQSVNLDIKSSREITLENFIKNDKAFREEFISILNSKANAAGAKHNVEAEGIKMYFQEDNIVFYYMPLDDSEANFIEININKSELGNLLNSNFGERPAS